jgi:hypothetical protein
MALPSEVYLGLRTYGLSVKTVECNEPSPPVQIVYFRSLSFDQSNNRGENYIRFMITLSNLTVSKFYITQNGIRKK